MIKLTILEAFKVLSLDKDTILTIMLWAKLVHIKQNDGSPRDEDEALFEKWHCANQGH